MSWNDDSSREENRYPSIAKTQPEKLGDFSVGSRVLKITALAIPIGAVAAFSALILLRLIAFFINVFYFGGFSPSALTAG